MRKDIQPHPCHEHTTKHSVYMTRGLEENTYMVFFLVKHERGNGPSSISTVTGLTTNMNGSAANAKLVLGAGNSAGRGRHSHWGQRGYYPGGKLRVF